jgi:hypothetical protein
VTAISGIIEAVRRIRGRRPGREAADHPEPGGS